MLPRKNFKILPTDYKNIDRTATEEADSRELKHSADSWDKHSLSTGPKGYAHW